MCYGEGFEKARSVPNGVFNIYRVDYEGERGDHPPRVPIKTSDSSALWNF